MQSRFTPQELYYRLNWRAHGIHAAAQQTRNRGSGLDFCGYAPFLDYPNPRRLDLRASLRSIPRQYVVRSYYERGSVNVYALVDMSSSMHFTGNTDKQTLLADISASIAWSANLSGDAFGLLASDDQIRDELSIHPSRQRNTAQETYSKLSQASIKQLQGAAALPLAAAQISHHRALVFLISDFHLEHNLLKQTFQALSAHDVVPVVLWDSAEYADLPKWGWSRVRDMESGNERSLFLRKAVNTNIHASYLQRRNQLKAMCREYGLRSPFFVGNTYSAEALTRHLLG